VLAGFLVPILGGKRPLRRPRRRWEDNIKIDFLSSGMGRMDFNCSDSGEGQVAGARKS
jgi:hypothetical protein